MSENGGSNWLATLGSWLVLPFKAILRPWWHQLVEKRADTLAAKQKLLEAVVRFRVSDYKSGHAIDQDRASGLAARVIDRLKPILSQNASIDPVSEGFLTTLEREIELHGIRLESWATLACLASIQNFDPRQAITIQFTDDNGRQSHSSSMIFSFQSGFPFTTILAISAHDSARLSPAALDLLKEYCLRNTIPQISFEVADGVPITGIMHQLQNTKTLPRGWKPN